MAGAPPAGWEITLGSTTPLSKCQWRFREQPVKAEPRSSPPTYITTRSAEAPQGTPFGTPLNASALPFLIDPPASSGPDRRAQRAGRQNGSARRPIRAEGSPSCEVDLARRPLCKRTCGAMPAAPQRPGRGAGRGAARDPTPPGAPGRPRACPQSAPGPTRSSSRVGASSDGRSG